LTQDINLRRGTIITLVTLLAVSFALFGQTWSQMVHVWNNSETFSHAWLIAPISFWLIWQRRQIFGRLAFRPSRIGIVLLFFACCLWILSQLAGVKVTEQFGVVGILIGIVVLILGRNVLNEFFFPLMFLFFMVPAGEGLTPLLMQHTADATVWALRLSNIAVFREGMHFALPTGRWSVVEACSGLRYVIAAGVLGVLFAHLNFKTLGKQVIFVLSCLVIAVLANWIRAYVVVLAGHFSGMRIGTGEDHIWFGWFFFGVVMALVFYIGLRFSNTSSKSLVDNQPSPLLANENRLEKISGWSKLAVYSFVTLFFLAGARYVVPVVQTRSVVPDLAISIGDHSKGFQAEAFAFKTGFKGAQQTLEGKFADGIAVSISQYGNQHLSNDMLAVGNRLVPEGDSAAVELPVLPNAPSLALTVGRAKAVPIRTAKGEFLVFHCYSVGKWTTSSAYLAKVFKLASVLLGDGDRSRSIAIAVDRTAKLDVGRIESVLHVLIE
jgi:exosortase A